jgi:hypothetical protein
VIASRCGAEASSVDALVPDEDEPVVAAAASSGVDSIAPDDPSPDAPALDMTLADPADSDAEPEEPGVDPFPLDADVPLEELVPDDTPVWAGVPASEQLQSRKMQQEPNRANRIGSLISTRDVTTLAVERRNTSSDSRSLG